MESDTQVPALSSSLVTKNRGWKKLAIHSTPLEMAMGWSPRPSGKNSQHHWSFLSEESSPDPMSQLVEFSPTATFRTKRLSTVQDLESPSGQEEPHSDPLAEEEEPRMSASLNKEQLQEVEALEAMSWPRNSGMPGISDTTRQRRRDPKKRAATMQRVRQWEAQLLQEIEEAVHHELTIQEGVLSTEPPEQAQGPLCFSSVRVDAQDPAALA